MDATPVSDDSDRALLARWCEDRDDRAFAVLVERHRPLVQAICRRELRDPSEMDDVVQEVFIVLAEEASSIRGSPGAWLRTVALHRSLNHVRARQRRRQHEQRCSAGVSTAAAAVDDAEEDLLTACLAELDPGERDLLVQLFFLGHSQAEVARSARVSALVVHRRLKRALASLRERFASRGRQVSPALLLLLLAGGDRALAASAVALPAAGPGWAVAAAAVAAGAVGWLILGASGDAAPPAASPSSPAAPPVVSSASRPPGPSAAPAATASAGPRSPDVVDDWGRRDAEPGEDWRGLLAGIEWQPIDRVRLRVSVQEEPGEAGSSEQIEDLLAQSQDLSSSPYARPIAGDAPAAMHLPSGGWLITPPRGRGLLLFSQDWSGKGPREQVVVIRSGGSGPRQYLWGISRQALVPDLPGGQLLSVSDYYQVDSRPAVGTKAIRSWVWRKASTSLRSLTLATPVVLAGWAVRPLPPSTATGLVDSCPAPGGSRDLEH